MIAHRPDEQKVLRMASSPEHNETLPYRIELWDASGRDSVERVLARALDAALARAMFKAARNEYPDRRVTLRRGTRIVADSAE